MVMKTVIVVLFLLVGLCCSAYADEIITDNKGNYQGKIVTSIMGADRIYDASGNYQGKVEKKEGEYWFYDKSGNYKGKAKEMSDGFRFYDRSGNVTGNIKKK
jgi:hypothetical protein